LTDLNTKQTVKVVELGNVMGDLNEEG